MTTDNFTEAARAEAERHTASWAEHADGSRDDQGAGDRALYINAHVFGAQWARTHLAAQEPTDAEVLAALNAHGVVLSPKMHPAPSLDYWGDKPVEAMRAALSAARRDPMKCPKCGGEMRSYGPWYEPPENRYDECRSCGHTDWPYWPDEEPR